MSSIPKRTGRGHGSLSFMWIPCKKLIKEGFSVSVGNVIQQVRELIHEGNAKRFVVKNKEAKMFLEIPVTFGVIGTVVAS